MTKVIQSRKFEKQLSKVPDYVFQKTNYWIFMVELKGIEYTMKNNRGYHDEALKGQRQGQRSIRLNKAYRLIYRIIEDRILIELLEIHKHDY